MPTTEGECGFTIEPLGETLLILHFGERIDIALNARVHEAVATLHAAALPGVVDLVPAYATLGLVYEPMIWSQGDGPPWRNLAGAVRAVFASPPGHALPAAAMIQIPVRYGGEDGPDLAAVAAHCGLAEAEVIARHTAAGYTVAMLGFAPGFPYLLGLDPALHTPRRANPRTQVPRGSVAIGGAQTGVYPCALPGGWQLIGRTPLTLFDSARQPPCLCAPGDRVSFRAIGDEEFAELLRGSA
ncbi:5-oxoprolinase subunit PxpB [Dokdonella soli]|uniref:5-oxoprolinase subunit PxpB n=1 Tax=Dokdonella soli TaxID=529810 RepID=A0ABN1IBK1_9GAMM